MEDPLETFTARCFMCNKPTLNPVDCPGCDAIRYCSIKHLKEHRALEHDATACCRFKRAREVQGVNAFPFPWHPSEAQPSKCTLLKELNVHNRGAWVRECSHSAGKAFGLNAPLLQRLWKKEKHVNITREKLAERLEDWWEVPEGSKLLLTSIQTPLPPPKDWTSYCAQRPLPLSSPLPVLLDAPLTMFWAVEKLRARRNGKLPQKLVIACIGAEKEVDQWPTLLELGALLPETDIVLHVIGPEVPCWADERSITVPNPTVNGYSSPGNPSSTSLKDEGAAVDGAQQQQREEQESTHSMQLVFHQGLFENIFKTRLSASTDCPDIMCGLNAGLGAYPTWMTGIMAVWRLMATGRKPEICLFTDYIAESIFIARTNIEKMLDPFSFMRMMFPGMGSGGADWRELFKLSDVEINPFRKPRWVKEVAHNMPLCPNGLAFWLEVR